MMSDLSLEQEYDITAALIGLESAEELETLRKEGAELVRRHLGCSHTEAIAVMKDLEARKRIEAKITPDGGQLDERRPMPVAGFKWSRLD
jgi:hypothetical protein